MIAGVDEAGRGPWAGPVVAAAVILGADVPAGLNDSKKLTAGRRELLFGALHASGAVIGVGLVSVTEIDAINILQATMLAMTRAVEALGDALAAAPAMVLVDGNHLPKWHWPSRAIIGGDALEPAISAASIIAKVTRDRLMQQLDGEFPGYGWARNKGYGTADHAAALAALGVTAHHRTSFKPVRDRLVRS
ncbi:ribonuclease HII [Sandarakinorhabdus sp.]|uniref:ribonuclease HII n=1 Tax=Sandarakinorhabdus sp. TaxID=1916663 RepID=UPI00286E9C94|nr:ribonuclease HII [Sandarakinorhabdus sp.]